jgi:hypothetical protein
MSETEQISEDQREATQKHNRDMQVLQFQLAESSDKASFEARCSADKLFARWRDRVEERLGEIRRQGQNVSRQDLFYHMIGKAAIEGRNSPENRKERRAAQKRVKSATARPTNSRSDEAPQGGQRRTSLAKRLENVQI